MHQDIFRKAVHRSLSKSPNPREVKNSASFTSPETSTHETTKDKRGKGKKKGKEEGAKTMARSDFTELQIHKPRGDEIHKSCGTDLDLLSKNLAETLLKGAIDLQVSIDMLESFQANVNRRKKGPEKGDAAEGWFAKDLNANRYISDGTSSKNNIDTLKKVISESLCKQNLITASSDDDEKNSSNQSNNDNSNYAKPPGIVAKLMGLREPPNDLERFQSTNWDAKVRSLRSLREVLDLERMPRVRKEKITQERIMPNRKALLDIMETMQFKGLMRNKQGNKDAEVFSVRGDQNTKSIRQENKKKPYRTKEANWEMINSKEDKIEPSKIVEVNNIKWNGVEIRTAGSVKKNEKKKIENSITSKAMQRSERNVARTSNTSKSQVTKSMPHNSTFPTRQKKIAVPVKSGSSNMLVDKKMKKEEKGFKSKIQKNGGTTNIHAHRLDSKQKPKKPDIMLSLEADNWTNQGMIYEAMIENKKSTRSQEEESEIRLLLLYNKSFTAFAKGDLKLCLDIAMEQISRKNLEYSFVYPSCCVGTLARRSYFCIEKLVAETTHGIRKLNGYQNEMKVDALKEDLYLKLDRDLQCSDLGINSIWDFGWSEWICAEEAGSVVCDFTDYVLSFLIEEISLDLYTFYF